MKNKIKEALKQKYGTRANKELGQLQLGIGDEVFERVAASVETLIADESAIGGFVNSENTLNLLKSYQSVNDKLRTLESRNEPPKPSETGDNNPEPNPNPEPPKPEQPDMAKLIADAVSAAIKPLSDKLTAFETEQNAKTALQGAEGAFKANEYVRKYKEEAEAAWEMTNEIRKYNPNWTEKEILDDAMARFNKAVSKKGVDTSKPFQGDCNPGADPEESNKAFAAEIRAALGIEEGK